MRGLILAVVAFGIGLAGCVGESSDPEEAVDSVTEELVQGAGPRVPDGGLKGVDVLDEEGVDGEGEEEGDTGLAGPGEKRSEPVPHPWVPKTSNVRDNDA